MSELNVNPSASSQVVWFAKLFSYQMAFASAFFMQRYVSKFLARIPFAIGNTLFRILMGKHDALYIEERTKEMDSNLSLYVTYPYFYRWKAIFISPKDLQGMCLPRNLERTPVLYLYGTDKNVMFHFPESIPLLQREQAQGRKSRAVAISNAGHWLYIQQENKCVGEISKFLNL